MKIRSLAVLVCLALCGLFLPAVSASGATTQKGTFYPVATSRILDTRNGTGAPAGQLGAGKSLNLQVSGHGHVPTAGVSAVVLNLTVTGATGSSFLTAYPTGASRPNISALNYRKGITRANIATVPLGSGGQVTIYNNNGAVSVLADVLGFYASDDTNLGTLGEGNEFQTLGPQRLIDTRKDAGGPLDGTGGDNYLTLGVRFGTNGTSSQYVKAMAVNITVVGATTGGYVSTWNGVGKAPGTSTLNFPDSAAIANAAVVQTSLCTSSCTGTPPIAQFAVANQSANPINVLVDLVGIYYNDGTAGLRFSPLATPTRITDSRIPQNGTTFTAQGTQTLTAPSSVAGADTAALVSNLTAVAPTSSTFLTVWSADDAARPGVSNLNTPAGVNAANGAVIPLSSTNRFNLFNNAGRTDFLVDVAGRFDAASGANAARALSSPRFSTTATSSVRSTDVARR